MMRYILSLLLATLTAAAFGQGHGTPVPPSLRSLNFVLGDWHGTQDFNPKLAGRAMTAKMELHAKRIIGGRYVEERITATLEGREPSDVRHLTTFDAKNDHLQAWWFDDANVGPLVLAGSQDGKNVVFTATRPPESKAPSMRATYTAVSRDEFKFKLEAKMGPNWVQLFETDYHRDTVGG